MGFCKMLLPGLVFRSPRGPPLSHCRHEVVATRLQLQSPGLHGRIAHGRRLVRAFIPSRAKLRGLTIVISYCTGVFFFNVCSSASPSRCPVPLSETPVTPSRSSKRARSFQLGVGPLQQYVDVHVHPSKSTVDSIVRYLPPKAQRQAASCVIHIGPSVGGLAAALREEPAVRMLEEGTS